LVFPLGRQPWRVANLKRYLRGGDMARSGYSGLHSWCPSAADIRPGLHGVECESTAPSERLNDVLEPTKLHCTGKKVNKKQRFRKRREPIYDHPSSAQRTVQILRYMIWKEALCDPWRLTSQPFLQAAVSRAFPSFLLLFSTSFAFAFFERRGVGFDEESAALSRTAKTIGLRLLCVGWRRC
jgi:hypothetical protein